MVETCLSFSNGLFYFLQLATNGAVTTWQVNFVDTSTLCTTERCLDRIPQHLMQENETHFMFSPVFRTYYRDKTGRTRRNCKANKTGTAVPQLLSVTSGKFIKLRHLSRRPYGTANEETGKKHNLMLFGPCIIVETCTDHQLNAQFFFIP